MSNEHDEIERLIEESSLGTPGARALRRRTPYSVVAATVAASEEQEPQSLALRKPSNVGSSCERALRRLAISNRDPVDHLQIAIEAANRKFFAAKHNALHELIIGPEPPQLSELPVDLRYRWHAQAIWSVIQTEVKRLDPGPETRRTRAAVVAALHLDPHNTASSIWNRLHSARDNGKFGVRPTGQRFGEDALRKWWSAGVRALGHNVAERLSYLAENPQGWKDYISVNPEALGGYSVELRNEAVELPVLERHRHDAHLLEPLLLAEDAEDWRGQLVLILNAASVSNRWLTAALGELNLPGEDRYESLLEQLTREVGTLIAHDHHSEVAIQVNTLNRNERKVAILGLRGGQRVWEVRLVLAEGEGVVQSARYAVAVATDKNRTSR